MAQQVEGLSAKSGNLSSVAGTCMVQGKNHLLKVIL